MSRNLFEYHPVLGYRFIPGLRARVRHEGGGYLVRCNHAGFRCDHELTTRRPEGGFRVGLFGDSYTAGEGVSNRFRFGDLLEARLPGLQVLNFGLPGSGTDQQYLTFREFARDLELDLVLLCPMVENVRRNRDTHRLTQSATDGRLVLRAKPYFVLREDGSLEPHHRPVPKDVVPADEATLPAASGPRTALRRAGAAVDRRLPGFLGWSRRLRGVSWPPDYDDPQHPGWRLMRAILSRWIGECHAPVMLCPLPTFEHVRREVRADGYRQRFAELGAEHDAEVVDVLPAFWRLPPRERRAARFPTDDHPSKRGHQILAEALSPALERRLRGAARAA